MEISNYDNKYENEPNRKVYTSNELNIPGLFLLAWNNSYRVRNPRMYHFHQERIEITFVVRGDIIYFIEGKEYHLSGGDVLVIPADLPHGTGTHPLGICEIYWIQLQLNDPSFLFLQKEWIAELQSLLIKFEAGVYRGVDFSQKYLANMFNLLTSNSVIDKYWGVSRLVHILHSLDKAHQIIKKILSADIKNAVDYILSNIYEDIRLESLADEAGLSLYYFKQKFSEQIGMSPRMFINSHKIEVAKELLGAGKSVTETASDLGFSSTAYFSTVFRKFTRLSPSKVIIKK